MENTHTAIEVLDDHDADIAYKMGYLAPELVAGTLIVGVAGKIVYRYRAKIAKVFVGAWEYLHTMDERFRAEIGGLPGEPNVSKSSSPRETGSARISEDTNTSPRKL